MTRRRWRGRVRIAFWGLLVGIIVTLMGEDVVSRRGASGHPRIRLVTVNVDTNPIRVAEALQPLKPDLVFMQETAHPCLDAGRILGLMASDGSDQCVLSRWPLVAGQVAWPGPWQPPQLAVVQLPRDGPLALVNVRLALPAGLAFLSGNAWYTAGQRHGQCPALRRLLAGQRRAIVCGDMNAFPLEMDLGARFHEAWTRLAYGATFPAWLPAARIDQCWTTPEVSVTAAWTESVPSDHRAVVVDLEVREPQEP